MIFSIGLALCVLSVLVGIHFEKQDQGQYGYEASRRVEATLYYTFRFGAILLLASLFHFGWYNML